MKQISPSYPEIWESLPILQALTSDSPLQGEIESLVELLHRRDYDISRGSGKEYATVVVAAADSHPSAKETADFVCDGIGDNETIQRAFTSITAFTLGGLARVGRIVLLEGTYAGSGVATLPTGYFVLEGQGSLQVSMMTGIDFAVEAGGSVWLDIQNISLWGNFDGTAGSATLALTNDTAFTGQITGIQGLTVIDSSLNGNNSGADTVSMTGQLRLHNATLAGTDQRSINGTSMTAARITDSHVRSLRLVATGSNRAITIDGATSVRTGNNSEHPSFDLTGWTAGHVHVRVHPSSGSYQAGSAVALTDCRNLVVTGRSSKLSAAKPQIKLSVGSATCDNNTIVGFIFEGNNEGPGTGATTHHVEIGTGVSNTKLLYNHYGGAASGNVLDSGTSTTMSSGGLSFTDLYPALSTTTGSLAAGASTLVSVPWANRAICSHLRVDLSAADAQVEIQVLRQSDNSSEAARMRNLVFRAVDVRNGFQREGGALFDYEDEDGGGNLHLWVKNTGTVTTTATLKLNSRVAQ